LFAVFKLIIVIFIGITYVSGKRVIGYWICLYFAVLMFYIAGIQEGLGSCLTKKLLDLAKPIITN